MLCTITFTSFYRVGGKNLNANMRANKPICMVQIRCQVKKKCIYRNNVKMHYKLQTLNTITYKYISCVTIQVCCY